MCCCCYRRTAHLVIVWLILICTIAFLMYMFLSAIDARGNYLGKVIAGIVACIIEIGICTLDIFGIKNSNSTYMIPFFISMIIAIVGSGVGGVIYIVMLARYNQFQESSFDLYILLITIYFLLFLLLCYFCFVIWSHIKEVRLARRVQEAHINNTLHWRKAGRDAWIPYNAPAVDPRIYYTGLPMERPVAGQHLRQDLQWSPQMTGYSYPSLP